MGREKYLGHNSSGKGHQQVEEIGNENSYDQAEQVLPEGYL